MIFTIAIDGPAAAGKGTLAKALAQHFGFAYLDTGLLYRATARKVLDGLDPVAAAKALSTHDFARDDLRTAKVGQGASKIAAMPKVRAALIDFQQKFARQQGGAVLDGRDIGTVICPQAEIKLFVTASDEVRAARRFAEISQKNETATLALVLEDLRQRDQRDRDRATAPMIQAQDSILLDTSDLDASQALAKAIAIVAVHPGLLT